MITDPGVLRARLPGMDHDLLAHYLQTYQALCAGDPSAGPLALAPPSERFHWLTAPRSDVVQTSPIHEGICDHPELALDILFATYVAGG